MQILWLVAVVAFLIIEANTYQMVSIWFVVGSIGALVAALCGAEPWLQITIFLVISVVLLIAFRPFALKKLKTDYKTNVDAAIGKKVVITQEVDNVKGTGEAKLDGKVWTVRSESDRTISVDDVAEVKRIEGVKLIVD